MRLKVVIEMDESGFYVAEVPALPGCLSQGKTLAQAKANIQEAIKGWIEVMNAKVAKRHAHQTYQKRYRPWASDSRSICSGAEAVKKFPRAGWSVDRQVGSHVMMVKSDYLYTLSISQHRELGIGLLRKLMKQAQTYTGTIQ